MSQIWEFHNKSLIIFAYMQFIFNAHTNTNCTRVDFHRSTIKKWHRINTLYLFSSKLLHTYIIGIVKIRPRPAEENVNAPEIHEYRHFRV